MAEMTTKTLNLGSNMCNNNIFKENSMVSRRETSIPLSLERQQDCKMISCRCFDKNTMKFTQVSLNSSKFFYLGH